MNFDLADHGKGCEGGYDYVELSMGGVTTSYLKIGAFNINHHAPIRINIFRHQPAYTHASFQMVENGWHAVSFDPTLVQTLFLLGEPATFHTRITERHSSWFEAVGTIVGGGLPRTVVLT